MLPTLQPADKQRQHVDYFTHISSSSARLDRLPSPTRTPSPIPHSLTNPTLPPLSSHPSAKGLSLCPRPPTTSGTRSTAHIAMATPPHLHISDQPVHEPEEIMLPSSHSPPLPASTSPPARGAEMRSFLQARLLQKNRAPPLVHSWDFWHDRQDRNNSANLSSVGPPPPQPQPEHGDPAHNYEDRLEVLAHVDDVRKFWNVFNNFDIARLQLRDSIHLFHKGVKPVWEDARNARGGAWTFRVPKALAREFWHECCMLAVGEHLQAAVESGRTSFRDDVCGVSLGVRFNSVLVQVWNRDGAHGRGIQRLLQTVLEGVSEPLRPREGSYYYKRHSEHAGFTGGPAAAAAAAPHDGDADAKPEGAGQMQSLDGVVQREA